MKLRLSKKKDKRNSIRAPVIFRVGCISMPFVPSDRSDARPNTKEKC